MTANRTALVDREYLVFPFRKASAAAGNADLLQHTTEDFAFEFWIDPQHTDGLNSTLKATILRKCSWNGAGYRNDIVGGKLEWTLQTIANATVTGNTNLVDGKGHKVIIINARQRSGRLYIWVDGILDGQSDLITDTTTSVSNAVVFRFGENAWDGMAFGGKLSNMRHYSDSLTEAQIAARFADSDDLTSILVNHWDCSDIFQSLDEAKYAAYLGNLRDRIGTAHLDLFDRVGFRQDRATRFSTSAVVLSGAVFSDIHHGRTPDPNTWDARAAMAQGVTEVNRRSVDIVSLTGDNNTGSSDSDNLQDVADAFANFVSRAGTNEVFWIYGNHDSNVAVIQAMSVLPVAYTSGETSVGYHSRDVNGVHLIGLYQAGITQGQVDWLTADLAAHADDDHIIVIGHERLSKDYVGGAGDFYTIDGHLVRDVLEAHQAVHGNIRLVINGHAHVWHYGTAWQGVQGVPGLKYLNNAAFIAAQRYMTFKLFADGTVEIRSYPILGTPSQHVFTWKNVSRR